MEQTVLHYTDAGQLFEIVEQAASLATAIPEAKQSIQEEGPLLNKVAQERRLSMSKENSANTKNVDKAKRLQAVDNDLSDFPSMPDTFIGETKMEQRRVWVFR